MPVELDEVPELVEADSVLDDVGVLATVLLRLLLVRDVVVSVVTEEGNECVELTVAVGQGVPVVNVSVSIVDVVAVVV